MRKFTYCLGMVLMFFISLSARAQDISEIGTPLIVNPEQLSSPFGELPENEGETCVLSSLIDQDPGTYWHTRWVGVAEDAHYLDIAFPEEISGNIILSVVRRSGAASDHPTAFKVEGSNDAEKWTEICTVTLPFTGAGTSADSEPFLIETPVTNLRFTATATAPNDIRVYWHCAEFQLYSIGGENEEGYVHYLLNQVLLKYDGHLVEDQFQFSEEIGDYTDRASYETFKEKVAWIQSYESGEIAETITLEQAQALIAEIEALYQAVLDSRVAMPAFADGYYFIKTAMEYTNEIRTPILDENGDPVLNEDGEEMVDVTVTHPEKAMYVANNALKWQSLEENKDATFLFKLTYNPETGNYDMMSCANDGRVATVAQSAAVTVDPTLANEVENEMKFTYVKTDEEKGLVIAICRADQGSTYTFLHQGGHGGGKGASGNVVGWESGADATWWCLAPVSEEEATAMIEEYAPIRDRDAMLQSVADMIAGGKEALVIAEDKITTLDTENPLITDASQFSSPYTHADEQKDADGNPYTNDNVYVLLLDGQDNTYWHSDWSSTVATGTHYLQVELADAEAVQAAAFTFTRRSSASDDHVTQWGVYGTNEAEAEKDACEHLAELLTPFSSKTETLTTAGFETKGYKYLRFYIDNTYMSNGTDSRGYGHVSEFQLYAATIAENPNSQKKMMGELVTNLEAAIAAVPADQDEITVEHYTALKEAYDAFMERYVNPADLRAAIATAEVVVPTVVEGNTPGFWEAGAADVLTAKIAEATAYDKSGVYSPDNSQAMIDALVETTAEVMAKAHGVEPGKWYRFRFASEEMYDANGWNKGNVLDESSQGNLYDQYVNVALRNAPEEGEVSIEPIYVEEMREGDALYFCNEVDEDASLFRFVNVGDTAYAIQNKGTGLYLNCAGANSSDVTMSLNPTTFKVKAIGLGEVLISGMSLTGDDCTNLHAQLAHHRLVTWGATDLGSNSGLMIEPADDVTGEPDGHINRDVIPGKIYAQCYPVAVGTPEGMYTVAGTFTKDEKHYIALNAIETAAAGEPFIYIHGEPSDFIVPEEGEEVVTETVPFTIGNGIVSEAGRVNDLIGTFTYQWVDVATTVFVDNRAEGATGEEDTDCTRDVSANTAYMDFGTTTVDANGNYSMVIEVEGTINTDAIENVINKVATSGRIYTIDGKLVRENGTLNDVKAMGKGVYILNGVKVSVNK